MFINPIEILNLSSFEFDSIDNALIKKSKRKLFAEFELSDDGLITYKNEKISKSDCDLFIEDLDSGDNLEFFYILSQNRELNDFLELGSENLFHSFKYESIYQNQTFLNFINPYFAERFSRAFLNAFRKNGSDVIVLMLQYKRLLEPDFTSIGFKDVIQEINRKIEETEVIKINISDKGNQMSYDNISILVSEVILKFDPESLNALLPYFQSQINKIAASINYMHLAIDNNYEFPPLSFKLLQHLFKLNIETASKHIYESNFEIIKEKNKIYVERWQNQNLSKKKPLLSDKLTNILVDKEKEKEHEELMQILENFSKAKDKVYVEPISILYANKNSSKGTSSFTKNDDRFWVVIVIVIIILFVIANYKSKPTEYNSNTSQTIYPEKTPAEMESKGSANSAVNGDANFRPSNNNSQNNSFTTIINGELYKSVEMKNGNVSGCDLIYSQYNKSLNNRLTITVNQNTDVAVKLILDQTDDCFRYVYIKGGTKYSIRNIPEGTYYLKIAYGNSWGVKNNSVKCKGRFLVNPSYKKSEEILDFNKIYNSANGSYEIPSYTLSLGVIERSEGESDFKSNSITDEDFNK